MTLLNKIEQYLEEGPTEQKRSLAKICNDLSDKIAKENDPKRRAFLQKRLKENKFKLSQLSMRK